jgi:long-chain acyl-CoA synthetase
LAIVCAERATSYAELATRVSRLASALRGLRLHDGDRVGLLAPNSDRVVESVYAVWWAGGVVNPINLRWNEWDMVRALDDCQTRILIVDDKMAGRVAELFARSEHLETVIYAGDGSPPSGMFSYETLVRESKPVTDLRRGGDQLAAVFYTGGGREPTKGVMLSHANIMSSVLGGLEQLTTEEDVGLHAIPLFHLSGAMFMVALTFRGATQILLPAFQVDEAVRLILEKGVTNTMLFPTMIHRILESPDLDGLTRADLRQVSCVDSSATDALAKICHGSLPSVRFVWLYGVPEVAPLVSIASFDDSAAKPAGTVGWPSLTNEIRVVGKDGKEVPRGKTGELVVRGAGLMQGYWNRPAATAEAIRDGWLHTGDAAYMTDAGELFVIGKLSDKVV